ncbi:hypothetical protein AAVH_28560 [Aphelenchoides avenae]|nr:hypothetical protein AAVH_28560 [Aphelenchus avenae]
MNMARLLRDHQRLTAWKVERALVFNDPIRAEEQRLLRPHGIGFHKSYSDAVKRSGHNRYNPCLLLLPVEIRTLIFERTLEQLTDLPSLGYGFRMLVDYYVRFAYVNAFFKDITMLTISGNTFHFLDDEPRRHKVLSFNASTREGLFGIHAMYALKTFGFLLLQTIMVTKQYYFHDRARSLRILHDFLPVEELSFPEGDTLWRDIPHDLIERVLSFQPSPLRLRGICDLLTDDLRYVPDDLLERARLIRRTEIILFDDAPQVITSFYQHHLHEDPLRSSRFPPYEAGDIDRVLQLFTTDDDFVTLNLDDADRFDIITVTIEIPWTSPFYLASIADDVVEHCKHVAPQLRNFHLTVQVQFQIDNFWPQGDGLPFWDFLRTCFVELDRRIRRQDAPFVTWASLEFHLCRRKADRDLTEQAAVRVANEAKQFCQTYHSDHTVTLTEDTARSEFVLTIQPFDILPQLKLDALVYFDRCMEWPRRDRTPRVQLTPRQSELQELEREVRYARLYHA